MESPLYYVSIDALRLKKEGNVGRRVGYDGFSVCDPNRRAVSDRLSCGGRLRERAAWL